jgi:hypothetical protein
MESLTLTVNLRGREFAVDVYADISSGGSSSWGSDEPPWFCAEVDSIRGVGRTKDVSNRLHNKIMEDYFDQIDDEFFSNQY